MPNKNKETVTIISPQLFAVYTLDKWFVKPFAGVGLGFNVNSMDLFELNNSFSFAVKGGAKVFVPDTSFYLGGTIKFNLNQSGFDTYYNDTIDVDLNAWSFNIGAGYRFN